MQIGRGEILSGQLDVLGVGGGFLCACASVIGGGVVKLGGDKNPSPCYSAILANENGGGGSAPLTAEAESTLTAERLWTVFSQRFDAALFRNWWVFAEHALRGRQVFGAGPAPVEPERQWSRSTGTSSPFAQLALVRENATWAFNSPKCRDHRGWHRRCFEDGWGRRSTMADVEFFVPEDDVLEDSRIVSPSPGVMGAVQESILAHLDLDAGGELGPGDTDRVESSAPGDGVESSAPGDEGSAPRATATSTAPVLPPAAATSPAVLPPAAATSPAEEETTPPAERTQMKIVDDSPTRTKPHLRPKRFGMGINMHLMAPLFGSPRARDAAVADSVHENKATAVLQHGQLWTEGIMSFFTQAGIKYLRDYDVDLFLLLTSPSREEFELDAIGFDEEGEDEKSPGNKTSLEQQQRMSLAEEERTFAARKARLKEAVWGADGMMWSEY